MKNLKLWATVLLLGLAAACGDDGNDAELGEVTSVANRIIESDLSGDADCRVLDELDSHLEPDVGADFNPLGIRPAAMFRNEQELEVGEMVARRGPNGVGFGMLVRSNARTRAADGPDGRAGVAVDPPADAAP